VVTKVSVIMVMSCDDSWYLRRVGIRGWRTLEG
jgi:hypothetical protein